jgi:hypothetical protein
MKAAEQTLKAVTLSLAVLQHANIRFVPLASALN